MYVMIPLAPLRSGLGLCVCVREKEREREGGRKGAVEPNKTCIDCNLSEHTLDVERL